mgnify:CR=1 FL=1|jgi:hypothetical protein|tara:strand:- start:512 stop:901 length:390 start_codon:yes stop_codon:yes gene_type:complete
MATLTPTLSLTSIDATADTLSVTATDTLTVTDPIIGLSRIAATTTGGNQIIAPNVDSIKYIYIKHTGVDAADAATTDTVSVEDTDDVQMAVLQPGEWMYMPHSKGTAKGVQLQSSANTVVCEYAYWTKG